MWELNLPLRKTGPGYGNLGFAARHIEKLQKGFSGMTDLVIVSSNVDVTTKYSRKKDSQHCVTAPFFATIYHDNRNHLGCCNAFWITGKVMLLVPYFRKTFLLCRHNLVLLNLIVILLWKNIVVNFFSLPLFLFHLVN